MKRVIPWTIVLMALSYAPAWAQTANETDAIFLKQAFIRVTDKAEDAGGLTGFGYARGISILGGWLNLGDSLTFTMPLDANVDYIFLAAGDNDAENINLDILDATGKAVATEDRDASFARVRYTPTVNGRFTLRLNLARSRKNFPCVCTACVLAKNGIPVSLKSLDDCAGAMLNLFTGADKLLREKDGKALQLRKAPNQWAVYGSVLVPGEDGVVTNLDLGVGRKLFLALGDKKTRDVDLFILDNTQRPVAQDTKTNPEGIVGFDPGVNQRYGVKMLNFQGDGPSVVMTAVLDVINAR